MNLMCQSTFTVLLGILHVGSEVLLNVTSLWWVYLDRAVISSGPEGVVFDNRTSQQNHS